MANPMDAILDAVEWKETGVEAGEEGGLPVVTHEGVLAFGEVSLRCYQLSNGQRVLDSDDVHRVLGFKVD